MTLFSQITLLIFVIVGMVMAAVIVAPAGDTQVGANPDPDSDDVPLNSEQSLVGLACIADTAAEPPMCPAIAAAEAVTQVWIEKSLSGPQEHWCEVISPREMAEFPDSSEDDEFVTAFMEHMAVAVPDSGPVDAIMTIVPREVILGCDITDGPQQFMVGPGYQTRECPDDLEAIVPLDQPDAAGCPRGESKGGSPGEWKQWNKHG